MKQSVLKQLKEKYFKDLDESEYNLVRRSQYHYYFIPYWHNREYKNYSELPVCRIGHFNVWFPFKYKQKYKVEIRKQQ